MAQTGNGVKFGLSVAGLVVISGVVFQFTHSAKPEAVEASSVTSSGAEQQNEMEKMETQTKSPTLFGFSLSMTDIAIYISLLVIGAILSKLYSMIMDGSALTKITIGGRNGSLSETTDPKKRAIVEMMDQQRAETYGSEYPNGWYHLMYSADLKPGQVELVTALGTQFAVFRGDKSGEISVLDPYCPHMGANLAVGGKVCDDSLECPFHRWRFATDGKCVSVPYSARDKTGDFPKYADAKTYPSMEYHGMICVYWDDLGRKPAYSLPIQKEIADGSMVYRGQLDAGSIHMHIQEFAENAADWMHFDPVHGMMMVPFTRLTIPIIHRWLRIEHKAGMLLGQKDKAEEVEKYGPNDKHFLYFLNHAQLKWNGELLPETDADVAVTFMGPAGINMFTFWIPRFGKIVMFHTHLPEGNMCLRTRFHWFAEKSVPRAMVYYVVGLWISQWSNDIDIWENKIFKQRPCLFKEDGPINRARIWFKQFYSSEEERAKHDSRRSLKKQTMSLPNVLKDSDVVSDEDETNEEEVGNAGNFDLSW